MTIESSLISLEQEFHMTLTRANYFRLNELLAEDFLEFGLSGNKWTRDEVLLRLPSEKRIISEIKSRDFKIKKLSEDLYLITYLSFRIIDSAEERVALRSSLWRNESGNWKIFFHQGTLKSAEEKKFS